MLYSSPTNCRAFFGVRMKALGDAPGKTKNPPSGWSPRWAACASIYRFPIARFPHTAAHFCGNNRNQNIALASVAHSNVKITMHAHGKSKRRVCRQGRRFWGRDAEYTRSELRHIHQNGTRVHVETAIKEADVVLGDQQREKREGAHPSSQSGGSEMKIVRTVLVMFAVSLLVATFAAGVGSRY